MKNTIKVFGIIAIVAVIGFSMSACGNETDDDEIKYTSEQKEVTTAGRLTISGLSAYNGKKISCMGWLYDEEQGQAIKSFYAYQTAYNEYVYKNGNLENTSYGKSEEGTITGGQVTLKVFTRSDVNGNGPNENYTGNDQNVFFSVRINDSNEGSVTVNFTNGIGNGAFVAD